MALRAIDEAPALAWRNFSSGGDPFAPHVGLLPDLSSPGGQPERQRTIRTMTATPAAHASVKETAARDTINLLLSLREAALVAYRRALTIGLTVPGERALRVALGRTRAQLGA